MVNESQLVGVIKQAKENDKDRKFTQSIEMIMVSFGYLMMKATWKELAILKDHLGILSLAERELQSLEPVAAMVVATVVATEVATVVAAVIRIGTGVISSDDPTLSSLRTISMLRVL